jgi:TetR/AcrR family transcriptional regulator, ethionamide resistance regulator
LSILSTRCIVDAMAASVDQPVRNGRRRRSTRVSGDDRERAIFQSAERLLEEKPLSEISVDDIAKGAGISRPTFYFYFPSKDAVVLTIVERIIPAETARSREEALALLTEDPRAGLKQALGGLYDAIRSRKGMAVAATELRATNQEARDLWGRIMEEWVSIVAAIVETERARGAAPEGAPARDLAIALVQMNERVQQGSLVGESPSIPEDRVIDVLVDIWLQAIYGTAEPS